MSAHIPRLRPPKPFARTVDVSKPDRTSTAIQTEQRTLPARYEERMAICRQCEHRREVSKTVLQCSKCGCIMNVKARFSGASCPINKW